MCILSQQKIILSVSFYFLNVTTRKFTITPRPALYSYGIALAKDCPKTFLHFGSTAYYFATFSNMKEEWLKHNKNDLLTKETGTYTNVYCIFFNLSYAVPTRWPFSHTTCLLRESPSKPEPSSLFFPPKFSELADLHPPRKNFISGKHPTSSGSKCGESGGAASSGIPFMVKYKVWC